MGKNGPFDLFVQILHSFMNGNLMVVFRVLISTINQFCFLLLSLLLLVWYDYLSECSHPILHMVILPEVIKLWFMDMEFPWLTQHRLFAAALWLHLNNKFGSWDSPLIRYG